MGIIKIPLNTCRGGHAVTIKANYWKVSISNFVHQDGLRATGIMEVYDNNRTDSEDNTGRVL